MKNILLAAAAMLMLSVALPAAAQTAPPLTVPRLTHYTPTALPANSPEVVQGIYAFFSAESGAPPLEVVSIVGRSQTVEQLYDAIDFYLATTQGQ